MVYSTNPDFQYDTGTAQGPVTLPPAQQDLRVWLDRKQRGGKVVTLVRGFVGCDADLQELARLLGGSEVTRNTLANAKELLAA
mgnify:FL=1